MEIRKLKKQKIHLNSGFFIFFPLPRRDKKKMTQVDVCMCSTHNIQTQPVAGPDFTRRDHSGVFTRLVMNRDSYQVVHTR